MDKKAADNNAVDNMAQKEGWHVRLNPETLPKLRVNQEYASLVKRGDDSRTTNICAKTLLMRDYSFAVLKSAIKTY